MAKTTTTKAKTKTTKRKPAVKAAAKTTKTAVKAKTTKAVATSKKVTKAPTKTTKSTIKAAAATRVTTRTGNTSVLQRPQVLLGGLFALLAVAAGFLMNNASVQLLLSHLTKDELASRTGTVLAPAAHVLYEVEFRWLLVGFLVLSAVLAVLRGTRYKAIEDAGARRKVQPLRWIDYGLTSAVAFSIAGLLNGLQDLVALKVSAVAILVAAYLGWVFERENAVNGKPARSVYAASAVLTVIPVVFLLVTMLSTNIYGMVRSPWYAYAAAAVAVLYVLLTTRMQWTAFKNKLDFVYADRAQNRFATVCKIALAVVLIVGLYK